MPRTKARTDSNQSRMVEHLRQCGLRVESMHQMGKGFPDLMVMGYHRGYNMHMWLGVEVKTEKGTLTPDQVAWHEALPEGAPVIVATESVQVLRWFGMV